MSAIEEDPAIVIGAGVGGLAAAITLAAAGVDVLVVDKNAVPGGKMRDIEVGGMHIGAGPSVFTMKWVFDALLEKAGTRLEDHIALEAVSCLARHFWPDGTRLDLFCDIDASADAIHSAFGLENAEGYRRFCADSARIFRLLQHNYIAAQRPSPVDLVTRIGPTRFGDMLALKPFSSMWAALGRYFRDPRLRQLFGRYATYCGSSPFKAPATLMLVAHVEQDGVWIVDGGMHGLAKALAGIAENRGATIRYGCGVDEITVGPDGANGVVLESGEHVRTSAIIFNGDVSALAKGGLGPLTRTPSPVQPADRSLSAMTWAIRAEAGALPLAHHTVLFSDAYEAEFDAIFTAGKVPDRPTVYICAQDRTDTGAFRNGQSEGGEGLFCLINAPANGDRHPYPDSETERCLSRMLAQMDRCGLALKADLVRAVPTTPASFNTLFPGSGGAIYGRASHGWTASFQRPGARTRIPGLYLAGGSVHPGPGVPMAALSGALAAESLVLDRASMPRFRPAAISGGMSTA